MAPQTGILYVTMEPQPTLPPSQFHDWYNNEHGPGRLRLPFVPNGFRYKASDLSADSPASPENPTWMAIYDVDDMSELTKSPYVDLRKAPIQSQRERDTMKQIKVDRKFYDLVDTRAAPDFKRLEDVEHEGKENVLIAVLITPKPGQKEEIEKWYAEEHTEMLSKVPGWLRTRRFVTAAVEGKETADILTLHEYAPQNGLGTSDQFKAALSTPWRAKLMTDSVQDSKRRVYNLAYTFGPAPRDLSTLSAPHESYDARTKTYPAGSNSNSSARGAIESFITTADGAVLPYKLEGSTDLHAPLIVLCNSILVDYGIWDGFVDAFLADPKNAKYRIVRYRKRGRSSVTGSTDPITVDRLAEDVVAILDALRVPRAAAVIGVSLGGATALNVGLKHASRTAAFVSCDTSAASPAGNSKAWGERIAITEKEGRTDAHGEKIVGEELAEVTARRWFVPESYDGAEMERECERVKRMIVENSLKGFKKSVTALFEYDMRPLLAEAGTKALFVVGAGDGVLPKSMKELAGTYGGGSAKFEVVEGAGHLPMVEKPREFAEKITSFLD